MRINAVHHVQILVPTDALDAARRFYCDVLQLAEIERDEEALGRPGFWLVAGSVQIHIGVEDGVDRHATRAHVAYDVDNLEQWRLHLEAARVETRACRPIPGMQRFDFRDPFGNRIELIQRI